MQRTSGAVLGSRSAAFASALAVLGAGLSVAPRSAHADTFDVGSLIIPMDTDYQDLGVFQAFGLVYALLRADIPVQWTIKPHKARGDADFVASAEDYVSGSVINAHGYRGGPFVIDSADADLAMPIIDLWQAGHTTTVHVVSAPFDANVARRLVTAPTIAILADGNEDIAFKYLRAAGIPDQFGNAWPTAKTGDHIYPNNPDAMSPELVAGTTASHHDGSLFDAQGNPLYCQIMTMHWSVNNVIDETVAELRDFLSHPVHVFAECQAVTALESNVYGKFLTPNGLLMAGKPGAITSLNADYPFAQMDGPFGIVGGSEPAYSLPPGDSYKDHDIVMLTDSKTPVGVQDLWMTGYLDAECHITGSGGNVISTGEPCTRHTGKVSYLGGHQYDVKVPLSHNPNSQGTRLFLNSLFEADCATVQGQPYVSLTQSGPATTSTATIPYQLSVSNFGPGPILSAVVIDTFPAGATVTSASDTYVVDNVAHTVTWSLGNLGAGAHKTLSLTVSVPGSGAYDNHAEVQYHVGENDRAVEAQVLWTQFAPDVDGDGCPDNVELAQGTSTATADTDQDGFNDCADTCPTLWNPIQDLSSDPAHCGACDHACTFAHASAGCEGGECVLAQCDDGWTNTNGAPDDGCENACTPSNTVDTTCDNHDDDCDGNRDEEYAVVACGVGACASFSACVQGVELACVPAPSSPEGLGIPGTCDNGIDDDCDGLADALDPGCGVAECSSAEQCDDGDPCTTEACADAHCVWTPSCVEDADAGSGSEEVAAETDQAETDQAETAAAEDETVAAETEQADTVVADTVTADTVVADTNVADESPVDTSVGETTVADTSVADTNGAEEATAAESVVADAGADSASEEATVADASGTDATAPDASGADTGAQATVSGGPSACGCDAATPGDGLVAALWFGGLLAMQRQAKRRAQGRTTSGR